MSSFAIYRKPYSRKCTVIGSDGNALAAESMAAADNLSGYLVAPLRISKRFPMVLIPDDCILTDCPDDAIPDDIAGRLTDTAIANARIYTDDGVSTPETYASDFETFCRILDADEVQKVVLSRCVGIPCAVADDALEMWREASRRYPRMYVALFSTPQTGTWLTATPEVLLESDGDRWYTMALAGTMPYQDGIQVESWSEKNRREQQYVSDFIHSRLRDVASDIDVSDAHTVRAAHLAHIRTDFRFKLLSTPGAVVDALHPTPAVCGCPEDAAISAISKHEHCRRAYYSGFSGPWQVGGETHLYVTLRCMEICRGGVYAYAGGGIVSGSNVDEEWAETEQKLQTMTDILSTKR